jgi:hypothetical protein
MRNVGNNRSSWKALIVGAITLFALTLVLAGCGALGGGSGNPLPTPVPGEVVGAAPKTQAKDTYQATWDSYLRDAIAADNQYEALRISMIQRYEKPSDTAKNLGGILKQTDLLTDRTALSLSTKNTIASGLADFDVRLTFANGDTDTRHCKQQVSLQLNADDKLWYVVTPVPLAVFSICSS